MDRCTLTGIIRYECHRRHPGLCPAPSRRRGPALPPSAEEKLLPAWTSGRGGWCGASGAVCWGVGIGAEEQGELSSTSAERPVAGESAGAVVESAVPAAV